jgi:predicted TIM-barrel fold metal-dependent hydrolase
MSDRGAGISRRALIGAGIGTLGSWAAWPATYVASTSGPRNSIDVHCHIFNAHDWAIRNGMLFIVLEKYSALADFVEPLVTLLAFIMDNDAPTAAQERAVLISGDLGASPPNRPSFEVGVTRALTRFGSGEDKFDPEGIRTLRGQSLKERKIRFLNQLLAEYGLRYRVRKLAPGSQEPELLTELANRIVAGVTRKNVGPKLRSYQAGFPSFEELSNWVRWAWGYTNWRFQILRNLASLSPQRTDEIRLYTPATIDFANWLDQTDTTPIEQQAEIMSLIAGLPQQGFGARGIIAFDPWRQVQAWKDSTTGPLDWVSDAFAAGGHVGVKIYPARGFRPYFNSRETYFPKKLRELTAPAPPGPELDRALGALYEWCLARDVPIMAHCAFSSFTEPKLGARASPFFWRDALGQFPKLRVNLAHCGGPWDLDHDPHRPEAETWTEEVIKLMNDSRYNVFADVADNSNVLENTIQDKDRNLRANKRLACYLSHAPRARTRLMYGTDWSPLGRELNADRYYSAMKTAFCTAMRFSPSEARGFMGDNAAQFLNLPQT